MIQSSDTENQVPVFAARLWVNENNWAEVDSEGSRRTVLEPVAENWTCGKTLFKFSYCFWHKWVLWSGWHSLLLFILLLLSSTNKTKWQINGQKWDEWWSESETNRWEDCENMFAGYIFQSHHTCLSYWWPIIWMKFCCRGRHDWRGKLGTEKK